MRIGILGGTFNPVHAGHLIAAELARDRFDLAKVLFMPCFTPPHKRVRDLASPRDRLTMVRLAIKGNPSFELSDAEIRRGGVSYSYETIRGLKASAGLGSGDAFFFLIGKDSLAQIASWYRIKDLRKLCRFIVIDRPGGLRATARELLQKMQPIDRRYFGKYVLDDFLVGISSHQIRQHLHKGHSIRYLVQERVREYIHHRGLYSRK